MRPKNLEKEEAIRTIALQIIAEEGLENLSMQKLAKAANVSPRTIYIKYENKEDFLVKLFIDEVLGAYEKAVLEKFKPEMVFAEGVKKLWANAFRFFKNNRPAYALMQYGKSSPLLNKAYQERDIKEGDFFSPIHRFLELNAKAGVIRKLPQEAYRAILFSPMFELTNEYFDCLDRPKQVVTDKVFADCCDAVIKGLLK
ncbi:TetR/AcrR family transcriptional regulator [Chitinophaga ginsengisoli]|uniref:TetR family transcriptional regulator n=1 Tax=Chitinophaga ginsengisoli TaxID=363837 RepID=A0A2P8FT20_9BACT|nr:TetR/AcrR family transcriptional regulator [Chitinophaga ginsengisoli]PSL24874.1 TetR family transcriptional regulator [Chitinophaga ginsengisoli]